MRAPARVFGGFCGVFSRSGVGSLVVICAGQVGEVERGWGRGELPGSPGGSPPRFPALLSRWGVIVAAGGPTAEAGATGRQQPG